MKTDIALLTSQELTRHQHSLNLIASENYPSPHVLDLLGSIWSIKYAEGYPGKRYYAGQIHTDELEQYAQQQALQVFAPQGGYGVNLQVLSGSLANAMVYLSVLEAGDSVLSLNLANGGHLSHMHKTSNWLKFFKHVTYDVKEIEPGTWEVDLEDFEHQLKVHKPKLTIVGFSAYPRTFEIQKLTQIAHKYGSLVLADIAHINGLVAAGLHESPFVNSDLGADFVSMTTHKTLRGPRGAMVFAKDEYMKQLNSTIFPGTSGGPNMQKIAAIAQCLDEILGVATYPDNRTFKDYSQAVLDTCKALENGLEAGGLDVVSPTQNHLCLVRLPESVDSVEFQKLLESYGVITNRNMIPNDTKSAWRPSGMRFGTAALASRGVTPDQAFQIGEAIARLATGEDVDTEIFTEVAKQLNWYYQ